MSTPGLTTDASVCALEPSWWGTHDQPVHHAATAAGQNRPEVGAQVRVAHDQTATPEPAPTVTETKAVKVKVTVTAHAASSWSAPSSASLEQLK